MKNHLVIAAILLLSIASASASAQNPPGAPGAATPKPVAPQPPTVNVAVPATKIAIVNTEMFGDEKTGVTRYVNAVKSLQASFQPRVKELSDLQSRIRAIGDEITKLSGNAVVSQESIQAKRDEGERLQRELQYKKEQYDADITKRYKEVVGPVSAEIGKAMDQYAIQHGLTMILDISKLMPAVITVNPATDITRAFITEYNSKNP